MARTDIGHVAVSGHQDDGKMNAKPGAPRLKIEPADAGQADVEKDAAWAVMRSGVEEFLNRRVGAHVKADGREQQTERLAGRHVVIDDMHGGPIRRHRVSRASQCGHGHSPRLWRWGHVALRKNTDRDRIRRLGQRLLYDRIVDTLVSGGAEPARRARLTLDLHLGGGRTNTKVPSTFYLVVAHA
jgi:hypothetical protein